jgi:hypothetical protein
MIRRTTWVLLALLVLVAVGYAALRLPATPPLASAPTAAEGQLWTLSADQVDTLRLVDRSDGGLLVVQRDPQSGWRMTAPRVDEADSGRIELALAWLLAPGVSQWLEDTSDLAAFGLEPPRAQFSVTLNDGSGRSIDVGRLDPTGSVYYVRLAGSSEVAMVSRYGVDDLLALIEDPPLAPATIEPAGSAVETAMP